MSRPRAASARRRWQLAVRHIRGAAIGRTGGPLSPRRAKRHRTDELRRRHGWQPAPFMRFAARVPRSTAVSASQQNGAQPRRARRLGGPWRSLRRAIGRTPASRWAPRREPTLSAERRSWHKGGCAAPRAHRWRRRFLRVRAKRRPRHAEPAASADRGDRGHGDRCPEPRSEPERCRQAGRSAAPSTS